MRLKWPAWLARLFWWRKKPALSAPYRPTAYRENVYVPPKENRHRRRVTDRLNRPKRGKAKARLRKEHLERLKQPRQRVLARMTNHQITWWQRDGRDEEHLTRSAEMWGLT